MPAVGAHHEARVNRSVLGLDADDPAVDLDQVRRLHAGADVGTRRDSGIDQQRVQGRAPNAEPG